MRKKVSRRKKGAKHRITKVIHESTREIKVDRSLTDNFIALQRVMVNLSLKFDSLSTQISRLLELFEISARNLARKDLGGLSHSPQASVDIKRVEQKLDNLASQAGLIGRGLALIHEVNSEKNMQTKPLIKIPMAQPQKPFVSETRLARPTMQQKPGLEEISSELSEYEKSESPSSKTPVEKP